MTDSDKRRFHAALTELAQLDTEGSSTALPTILRIAARTIGTERASFWELAPSGAAMTRRVLHAEDGDGPTGEMRADEAPAYFAALAENRPIVADDAATDPRTRELDGSHLRPRSVTALIDVPVWRRGRLAGVVRYERLGAGRAWTMDEQDFALAVGNVVSTALEALDRRRAEQAYAMIARASNDVLWDWDMVHDVVTWNEAFHGAFRFRPEEVGASAQWWLDHVHPDDRGRIKHALQTTIDSGGTVWNEQYRWIRGDGTVATMIDRGYLARDERGHPVRMIGSMLDVSERVELQARMALSDRMASIGTLAAGVAHEINNPLTYISANLNYLAADVRNGRLDSESLLELAREALEGAERIRRVVRDLQTFARPRGDDVEALDLQAVIESAVSLASNHIRHRAEMVQEHGPAPRVQGNRARLGQVVVNLLINAAQAIPEGRAEHNRVRVRTGTAADGSALLEVSDTGCGIPAAIRPHIFEPFFTTKPVGQGTGLGLSICHSIVSAAGGRIEVEDPPGGGCLVRVTLPAMSGDRMVAAAATPPVVGSRRRVLLVDDEPPIRRALRRLLEPSHEVVLVDSGEAALDYVLSGAGCDIILCDLMMPRMSGMELYERVSADAPDHTKRFIFMTGGAFSQRASEFIDSCDRPVLEKPIDPAALARLIAQI